MDISNENSEAHIKKLDSKMTIKTPTIYDKGYVINKGGAMVVVAKHDVEKYSSRDGWKKATTKDIEKYLGNTAEPTEEKTEEESEEGDGIVTSADIRGLGKKKLKKFMKDYAGELEGIQFADDATDSDKKDAIITHLGLEE